MTERKQLKNHTTRSVVAAAGWSGIVFGSIFLLVGVGMLALVTQRYAETPEEKGLLAGAGVCLLFTGIGGVFISNGAKGLALGRRRRRLLAENQSEPWLADHPWRDSSIAADRRGSVVHGIGCLTILCLFLMPLNWFAFYSGEAPWPLKVVIGLLDLSPLVLLGGLAYEHWKRIRWGRARLELDSFPLFVGQRLGARLVPARALRDVKLELTLRCVEEAHEGRPNSSGRGTTNVVVAYSHHDTAQTIDLTGSAGDGIRVSFDLPREAPGTRLSVDPPTYWELVAKADTPGVDFEEIFLLPVYKR